MLEPFWDPRWNNFGSILKPRRLVTRLPYHSRYHEIPDTQGRRVPALALTIFEEEEEEEEKKKCKSKCRYGF